MRLVFAGTPAVACPSLDALVSSGHEVVAVVTRPDAARGRSARPVLSDVGARAAELGIPVLKPTHPRDPEFIEQLRSLEPDACPVVAYGALLPQGVLDVPRYGWVNLHFSLLPRWRGAAPVQHAILAGDEVTGATTFRIVAELDAGPVYGSTILPLDGTETSGEVLATLAEEGAELLRDTVDGLPSTTPVEQETDGLTLAGKITVADARIDWTRPADELDRLIRACSPEPSAWTTLDGDRFRIAYARPTDEVDLAPGELRVEKRRVLVGTGAGALDLHRVQPQGRKPMTGADWGRGLHTAPGRFA